MMGKDVAKTEMVEVKHDLTPYEEACRIWGSMPDLNKYGYKIDIRDPKIAKYYRVYKERIGEGNFPVSDLQRIEFEIQYLEAVVKRRREIAEKAHSQSNAAGK